MPPSPTVPSRHCGRSQSGPESPSRASQSPRTPGAPRARSLRAAVLLTLGALVGGAAGLSCQPEAPPAAPVTRTAPGAKPAGDAA